VTVNRDSAVHVPVFGTRYTATARCAPWEFRAVVEEQRSRHTHQRLAPSKVIDVPTPSHGSLPLATTAGADQPPLEFRLDT
jgi:hypothetical protein